jgi:hypothetical protein
MDHRIQQWMVRAPKPRVARWGLVAGALMLVGAIDGCSSPTPAATPRADASTGGRRTPIVPGTPEPDRLAALADLDPVWVRRTQIAGMYDGQRTFFRGRTSDATGPSTRANSPTFQIVLGNRSGSQGPDADRDGLSDAAEARIGTDPRSFDTDGDTIPDGFEIFGTLTNPLLRDSDGTGTDDSVEIDLDDPMSYVDSDGDGLTNSQERAALDSDTEAGDSDGDGFNDGDEFLMNTPMSDREHPERDTDGDHMPEDFEEANAGDPSNMVDEDHDGLPGWLDPDDVGTTAMVAGRGGVVRAHGPPSDLRTRQGFNLRAEACMSTAPPGVGFRVVSGSDGGSWSPEGRDINQPIVATQSAECLAGDVAVGVSVTVGDGLVQGIGLRCASVDNAGTGLCAGTNLYWRGQAGGEQRMCPPNQMVIGMRTRIGSVFDGIAPRCAPIGWNGDTRRTELENAGGMGGDVSDHVCSQANAALTSVEVATVRYRITNSFGFAKQIPVVARLRARCTQMLRRAIAEVGPQEIGPTRAGSISLQGQAPASLDLPQRAECPDGQVAVGISVESNFNGKPSFTRLSCAPLDAAGTAFGAASWFPVAPRISSVMGMCEPRHHLVGVRLAWSGPATSTDRHVHAITAVCAPLGWISGVPTTTLGPWGTGFSPDNVQEALCPASSAIERLDVQFVTGTAGGDLSRSVIGALSASCRSFVARGSSPTADAGVPGDAAVDASDPGYTISDTSAGAFDFQGTVDRVNPGLSIRSPAPSPAVVTNECPAETVAIGVAMLFIQGSPSEARQLCAPLSRDRRGFGLPSWAGAAPGADWEMGFCPAGQHVVGMRADGFEFVNRLGVVCAPLGWNAASRLSEAGLFGSASGDHDEGFCDAGGGLYRLDIRQVSTDRTTPPADGPTPRLAQAVLARCRGIIGMVSGPGADAGTDAGTDAGADAGARSDVPRYGVYQPRAVAMDLNIGTGSGVGPTGCPDDQVAVGIKLVSPIGSGGRQSQVIPNCTNFTFDRRSLAPYPRASCNFPGHSCQDRFCPAGQVVVGIRRGAINVVAVLCAPLALSASSMITPVLYYQDRPEPSPIDSVCPPGTAVTLFEQGESPFAGFGRLERLRMSCNPLTPNGAATAMDGGVMDGGAMDGGAMDASVDASD